MKGSLFSAHEAASVDIHIRYTMDYADDLSTLESCRRLWMDVETTPKHKQSIFTIFKSIDTTADLNDVSHDSIFNIFCTTPPPCDNRTDSQSLASEFHEGNHATNFKNESRLLKVTDQRRHYEEETNISATFQKHQIDLKYTAAHKFPSNGYDHDGIAQPINFLNTSKNEIKHPLTSLNQTYSTFQDSAVEQAANWYHFSEAFNRANCRWLGSLPIRSKKNSSFSRKVFLGGVPWDITKLDLINAFGCFGTFDVQWPVKNCGFNQCRKLRAAPKGYCYLIFEHQFSICELLKRCTLSDDDYYYFKITSNKMKEKDAQVIPWCIDDSHFQTNGQPSNMEDVTNVLSGYRNTNHTVFTGALHGMMTAENLAYIMENLFGPVLSVFLDTDKVLYPIGSGRVTFQFKQSYLKAVQANFIEVKTQKFTKTIQIDPFLKESICQQCVSASGTYFCRSLSCFRYFCSACWDLWHQAFDLNCNHIPLKRSCKTNGGPIFISDKFR